MSEPERLHYSDYQRAAKKAKNNHLEEMLDKQLRDRGIDTKHPYGRQVKFHPERNFRADFLWAEPAGLLVEVDGGTHSGGRHTRGVGFENDREKDHLAALMGYVPLHFTAKQVKSEVAANVIEDWLRFFGEGRIERGSVA